MKPRFSTGVLLLSFAGVSAYAITAIIAETNRLFGTTSRTPADAIGKSLTIIRADHHILDKIARPLVPAGSWRLDDDPMTGSRPERTPVPAGRTEEDL